MKITLKKLMIQNFKGCSSRTVEFSDRTEISGANATGKTTIFDACTWLLFNKDSSGAEKFEIRPLDFDGNKIHNIEICVEGEFLWEYGEEKSVRTLKKTMKEKWVKKRGSGVAELQGNEIAYEVDGYPRSEKEYKEVVSSWVDESVFKMITNPQYFPGMPWKEQRAVLMMLAESMDDVELAKAMGGYEDIIDELGKAPSTDDILAKYKKSALELKKQQAEIPVRIDELSKQIVSVDVASLEKERAAIEQQMDALRNGDDVLTKRTEIQKQIAELRDSIQEIEDKACAGKQEALRSLQEKISALSNSAETLKQKSGELSRIRSMMASENDRIGFLRTQWNEENARTFDGDTKCPYCGQELPEDAVKKMMDEFSEKKSSVLARIKRDGDTALANIADMKEKESALAKETASLEKSIGSDWEANLEELKISYATAKARPIIIEAYEIEQEISEKEHELRSLSVDGNKEAIAELAAKKSEVDAKIAAAMANKELESRIEELRESQKDVAQKVLDCEKMVFLTEQFIRAKMDRISEQINGKFDGVNFKLFDLQLNGGLKETCECTINGVPYASANNGHRIVAGLKIIQTLQRIYGVSAPIFVDNAEAVNDINYPAMDCQMVFLKVTDSKELEIK